MADGNFAKAAEFMKAQNQLKDTLMNNESKTIIAEMETRFQVREKNKTIHLLELQDELNRRKIRNQVWVLILLIIISLLIMAVFIFSYNRYKLKDKQLRLELQNYLLRIDKLQNEVKEKVTENKFSEDKLNYYQLTEREVEVLNLIASGYKNAEIAEQLFVSQNTIKTHIKNIYVKLDVKNRIEALKKVDIV
jgi:ATP/maltotriose-dependent transcriptional regulator MalT